MLQAGNTLALTWRARLHEHLGNFRAEPVTELPQYVQVDLNGASVEAGRVLVYEVSVDINATWSIGLTAKSSQPAALRHCSTSKPTCSTRLRTYWASSGTR